MKLKCRHKIHEIPGFRKNYGSIVGQKLRQNWHDVVELAKVIVGQDIAGQTC